MDGTMVKAAVVQAALTRDAAVQGAALVVFPEAFVGGNPKGLDFGARLGSRSAVRRDGFRRYFESAIEHGNSRKSMASLIEAEAHFRLRAIP